MYKVLKNSWALFLGMSFIMMAYGFQGSLLGVRAVQEEFSLTATGFLMSGYFIGYFIGAATIPNVISRVGHVRVFAAFASLASLIILIHSILIHPFIWFLLRLLTGISMVCMYTVAESWLNDRSSNKNRGSVLSIYMVILYGSIGIGMFLLNFSTPKNFQPFILVSVITSAALIPILLTKKKPPTFKKINVMTFNELYKVSPFGIVSSFFYGTIQSALFTLLAVYATSMNFTILEISIVTFLLAISGAIAQFPIGKISDVYDRRKVIVASTFGAAIFALITIFVTGQMYLPDGLATSKKWFYIFFTFFSFCSLPMFSLILAHTNDYITKDKFVAAGAGLQFTFGLGAMSGPFLCSIFMDLVGSNGFFVFLFIFHSLIGFFGIYRMKVRETVDNPDSQFVAMPQTITPAGIELNPTTEPIEEPIKDENKQT
ncbi:MFS transporter [Candidatus Pelagibacter sp.]|nr:MFS transporter [Candidatus Pelagibacter sp.]